MENKTVGAVLLDRWHAARAELRALEVAEHPPIIDKFGREWTWKDENLYTHDSMAWPATIFDGPDSYGLPKASALNNPNYVFCDTCKGVSESALEGTPLDEIPHADYPHEPGRLDDCPRCEAECFCTGRPEHTECVFCASLSLA